MKGPRVEYNAHSVKIISEHFGDIFFLTELNLHNHSLLYILECLYLNVTGINKIILREFFLKESLL